MTTNKPDKTGLQGQIDTLRRSNEVLRQTYLHLRDANADLMKIIDTFIKTRNPDPRQGQMHLEANDMKAMQDQGAEDAGFTCDTVAQPRLCPGCDTPLKAGDRVYVENMVPCHCRKCFGT